MALQGTIGFLGYGNMGQAILGGLINQKVIRANQAIIYDPAVASQQAAEGLDVAIAATPEALAGRSDILMLAVKPQMMDQALAQLGDALSADALIISIAAGISIDFIQKRLGADRRVVRVMPNTPALVQTGAAGIALSESCTEEDATAARTIFESIGLAALVQESDIDAVTALSGSGPAYFFYMVECLVKAAVAEGLDEDTATMLAGQTMLGAGKLLMESGESAATLRERVTSKGGTTAAALAQFQADGLETVIAAGVTAAANRSRELGS